ncbi:MAG: polysaccharide deacetylase family protein [Xanthomonadaceae bacterium]|nr:polysaccharide deacetylase family protein [Xanthomonadaceae bacterium]
MVREGEFDAQIRHLATDYNCLSLPEAVRLLQDRKLPKRSVVVTFDDGYLDNLTLALPILKAYGVPAMLYVTTGFVDHTSNLWWYELEFIIHHKQRLDYYWDGRHRTENTVGNHRKRLCFVRLSRMLKRMTPVNQEQFLEQLRSGFTPLPFSYRDHLLDAKQVGALANDPLITIGAHSHHHPVFSSLNNAQLRRELLSSTKLLEQWVGRPVSHLAYPFGGRKQAGRREFRIARELGFASATTTRMGHLHSFHATQLHALPRIAVGNGDTMTSFRWKLSGLECLMRRPFARILI